MRRLYATLLLCLFGLMPAAPLLALTASASVAVCCRAGGMHHCMAAMNSTAPAWRAPCPMERPQAAAMVHAPAADATVGTAQVACESLRAPPVAGAAGPATRLIEAQSSRGPPALIRR